MLRVGCQCSIRFWINYNRLPCFLGVDGAYHQPTFFVKAGPKHLKGALGQRESDKTVLFPLDKVSTRVEFYSIEVVPTYR